MVLLLALAVLLFASVILFGADRLPEFLKPVLLPLPAVIAFVSLAVSGMEFIKTGESMTHRRRVTPGDYLDKLKPSTIRTLNRRFADVLSRFGYST